MKLIGATYQRTPGDGALQCDVVLIIFLIGGSFELLLSQFATKAWIPLLGLLSAVLLQTMMRPLQIGMIYNAP